MKPRLIILAGPNGAGKTTAAMYILKSLWNCQDYINANKIAEGLSPLNADRMNLKAGKIMLQRIQECLAQKTSFAFETTLASRTFLRTIDQAHARGYHVHLLFFWLHSISLAQKRVLQRIQAGGHAIPPDVIRRRYSRGLQNFPLYTQKVDTWEVIDSTSCAPHFMAQQDLDSHLKIMDETRWTLFQKAL